MSRSASKSKSSKKVATLQPKWKTKDGREIPIKDLGDGHLENILNLLIRHAVVKRCQTELAYLRPAFGGPRGDMAQDAFDQEFDGICQLTTEDYFLPIWWDLEAEAKKREIKIPPIPTEEQILIYIIKGAMQ